MPTTGLFSMAAARYHSAMNFSKTALSAISIVAALLLSGCGGGSGSDDGAESYDFAPDTVVNGAAVDGPLLFADVAVYRLDLTAENLRTGAALATGTTNDQARIIDLTISGNDIGTGPFLIEFTCDNGCEDSATGAAPVIGTLRSVISAEQLIAGDNAVYATALSTLALELAHQYLLDNSNLSNDAALLAAQRAVRNVYGFDLLGSATDAIDLFTTAPLPTTGADQQQSLNYFIAAEVFTAIINNIKTSDATATAADTLEMLIIKLAQDLSDGVIDSEKNNTPLPRLTASLI
ncbi:hypothetical protein [Oceanicoccus sp. KOV_DT_Chl]|uniref:hypothetical protein n=1 Tax=Oceanicoccus sp. KOV_DT_Chl TaxID=1904639 RepID=UPI000C7BB601|nr:hypothetical protein [Oceanicoccus sp. KOV_DT_Chl]